MTKEELSLLEEDGKYEVKQIEIKGHKAIFRMSFDLYRKAFSALIDMDFKKTGKGKSDTDMKISIDEIGAGDKVLFQGWHSGDEEIRKNMRLRVQACKVLGQWVQEISDDMETDEGEKKS